MEVTRRRFIKMGGMGLVAALAWQTGIIKIPGKVVLANETGGKPLHKWRFIVDTRKCIGCGRCIKACKLENNVLLEPGYNRTWVERYAFGDNEEVFVDSPDAGINSFSTQDVESRYDGVDIIKSMFVPKLCNQCHKPPCVPVCPVGATKSTEDGVVLIDSKACIGCRYCIQACPYGARYFDPRFKIVDKCTWCYHRITKGLPPACVEVCPVGARIFGDISDPESPVTELLKRETVGVLKAELGTDPKVFYIGLEKGVR